MASPSRPSIAGRIYLSFIGITLALIGGVFFWLMWRSFDRALHMQEWPEIPCVILSSEIEERRIDPNSNPEFRVNITYGYQFAGEARTGDHLTWRGNPWTSKRNVIEARVEKFRPGTSSTCRVNPQDPAFSVLQPDSKAPGYSIWFPALFIVGGLGITVRACWPTKKLQEEPAKA